MLLDCTDRNSEMLRDLGVPLPLKPTQDENGPGTLGERKQSGGNGIQVFLRAEHPFGIELVITLAICIQHDVQIHMSYGAAARTVGQDAYRSPQHIASEMTNGLAAVARDDPRKHVLHQIFDFAFIANPAPEISG
jgi:hypothetical protein